MPLAPRHPRVSTLAPMNTGLLHALRVIHVLGGAFWFGAAVMNAFFLAPTLRAVGPTGGEVMRHLAAVKRLPLWVNVAAWLTILSGVWLYGWRSSWFTAPWMGSGPGIVYGIGGVAAIAAALVGAAFIAPNAKRAGALAASVSPAGGPPPPEVAAEMRRRQRTMAAASLVAVALVVVAALCMAVARYT